MVVDSKETSPLIREAYNGKHITMKMNVLVVEDEMDMHDVFQLMVTSAGHNVTIVGTKTEATDMLARKDFDLVFTDNDMPARKGHPVSRDQGLEIIRCAREIPYVPHIVWMSGRASTDEVLVQKAIDCGADQILAKPFRMDEFTNILNHASARKMLEAIPA